MTKPSNTDTIETATGIAWKDWVSYLKDNHADKLPHTDIASLAYAMIGKDRKSRGWWSQTVAVAYEQEIGRRQPGQRSDGTYEISASKTFNAGMDESINAWKDAVASLAEFNGIKLASTPTESKTEKWRNWRANMADGSKIIVTATDKSAGKSVLTVTTQKLASHEGTETWRAFWKEFLATI